MRRTAITKQQRADPDIAPLTRAQIAELNRRLADASDRRRYLIVSRLLPGARFVLYYNVSDDVYAWNEPEGGTLFKRRATARLIQGRLGRGTEVIEVKLVRGKIIGAPRRRKVR